MQNVWSVPCRFSGLNPPSAVAGDPPGDPPLKPLTLPTKTPPFHHKTFQPYLIQNLFQSPQLVSDLCLLPLLNAKRAFLKLQKSQWLQLILLLLGATLLHVTVTIPNPEASLMENFTTLPPKSSSPFHTNPASSPHVPSHNLTPINQTALPQNLVHVPPDTSTYQTSSVQQPSSSPTLVERIRLSEDKTLRRRAHVTIAPSSRPTFMTRFSKTVQSFIKTL